MNFIALEEMQSIFKYKVYRAFQSTTAVLQLCVLLDLVQRNLSLFPERMKNVIQTPDQLLLTEGCTKMAFFVDPTESSFPNTDNFLFPFPHLSSLWVPGSVLKTQASKFSSETHIPWSDNYPVCSMLSSLLFPDLSHIQVQIFKAFQGLKISSVKSYICCDQPKHWRKKQF